MIYIDVCSHDEKKTKKVKTIRLYMLVTRELSSLREAVG